MRFSKGVRLFIIISLIIINIGCDQVSKSVARANIETRENIPIIGQKLILTKVENKGAFLGVLSNLENPVLRTLVLIILPIIVLLIVLRTLIIKTNLDNYTVFGFCCVIGGGIGNLYDRIVYQSVTDFVHIDLGGIFKTGIFNFADVSVMIGLGFLFFSLFKNKESTIF